MCISIDKKKYWIHRSFEFQPSSDRALWQRTIRLIDDATSEILLQNANCVNPWIDENVGKFSHFLLTTIVSQSNDSDFFSLGPKEQKSIIDSLLQLNVCEEFRVLLKESVKNHDYALDRITTYETGLNQTTKMFQQDGNDDITALEERQAFLRLETHRLEQILQKSKQQFSGVPERAFQTPLSDYEASLRALTNIMETEIEGTESYDDLKKQRQQLRDRLAVLKAKRFSKPLLLSNTTNVPSQNSFDSLEQQLNEVKMKRAPLGFTSSRLYDSKAHETWNQRKQAFKNVNPTIAPSLPVKTLQKQYKEKRDELDTYELDEADFPRLSQKVLTGLEKQSTLLSKDLSELDYLDQSVKKQLKNLQITADLRLRNADYREKTKAITDMFQTTDLQLIKERMDDATVVQLSIDITHRDIAAVQETLAIDETVNYNPACKDCVMNPHRQRKESLLEKRADLQATLTKQTTLLLDTLKIKTPYKIVKSLYDTWIKSEIKTNLALETQEQALIEQLATNAEKIKSKTEELEELDYENVEMANTYYLLKDDVQTTKLELEAAIYEEEEQEWLRAAKISELDSQILQIENMTQIAHASELIQKEQELRAVESQLQVHDEKQNAQLRFAETQTICDAYPFYKTYINTEKQYKPLNQELASLVARLDQIRATNEKLSATLSESQRIAAYREDITTRFTLISKMSEAFEQYTDWLYPTKVGPAIEDAVNKVLNSIALPRPITLKAVWEQGQFGWYLEDGVSQPPYEKCSGAQRFFAGLALRIAFSRMGTSNMINSQIFLDEGFTACDAETMERVPALLKNLLRDLDYMQTIYLVSHLDSLKTVANCSISIVRGAHASRLAIGPKFAVPKGLTKTQLAEDGTVIKVKRGRPANKKAEAPL
jgi:DNA repair exonuclease SbcCD ATPase subunit